MGKANGIGGQFTPHLIEMLESPAYRALSYSGLRVLSRIEIELGHHGGNENGKLPVTFDDFHAYGIHRHAIAPGIRECVVLGFLEITEAGRAGNARWRKPNLFRLTYMPVRAKGTYGKAALASHEWRKIDSAETAERLAKEARRAKRRCVPKNKTPVPVNATFQ